MECQNLPTDGHASRAYAPILCLAFSPNGDVLASGSGDQSVRLWSVASGMEQTPAFFERREKRGRIVSIVFSPDGDELAFATPDFVSIWELSRPEHRFSLAARRRGSIWLAQYSPQGTLLATANGANDVRSRTFRRKKGSGDSSNPVKENEIRLWDAATGHERGSLSGHHGPVRALDFSPDGKFLASGSADKTVKIGTSRDLRNRLLPPQSARWRRRRWKPPALQQKAPIPPPIPTTSKRTMRSSS